MSRKRNSLKETEIEEVEYMDEQEQEKLIENIEKENQFWNKILSYLLSLATLIMTIIFPILFNKKLGWFLTLHCSLCLLSTAIVFIFPFKKTTTIERRSSSQQEELYQSSEDNFIKQLQTDFNNNQWKLPLILSHLLPALFGYLMSQWHSVLLVPFSMSCVVLGLASLWISQSETVIYSLNQLKYKYKGA